MSAVGGRPGNATTTDASASTGTAAAERPTDLPTSAKTQMEAVGSDPQATLVAGQDILREVRGSHVWVAVWTAACTA